MIPNIEEEDSDKEMKQKIKSNKNKETGREKKLAMKIFPRRWSGETTK